MSVLVSGRLTSPTATELVHKPSGAVIGTVAPRDNGGDGSRFSPTDLCAASLAACSATTIALFASRAGIPLSGIEFTIEKSMTQAPPRRIARLVARFRIASPCDETTFQKLVNAGRTCPVKRSLHPEVVVDETYERA